MAVTRRTLSLEQDLLDGLAKITDAHTRTMVKAWAEAWDEVAPDVTDALNALLQAGPKVTRSQLLRSARLQKALRVIAVRLSELVAETGILVTGDLFAVVDAAGKAQARIVSSQLPTRSELVDLDAWSRVDEAQLNAIVRRSTEQITARSRPLSTQAYSAVRRELVRGVASGSNPKETARRIVRRAEFQFNGGLSRAMTIARTETLDAHRAAAALGQEAHADVLQGWQWLAELNTRTCPACWGMNGTIHSLDESGPDGHQNCRCSRIPVTKTWADLGLKGTEPPSLLPSTTDTFEALPKADQVKILGPRGYDAWKAGKFPPTAWAKRQKNPGWRDSYVPAKAPTVRRTIAA